MTIAAQLSHIAKCIGLSENQMAVIYREARESLSLPRGKQRGRNAAALTQEEITCLLENAVMSKLMDASKNYLDKFKGDPTATLETENGKDGAPTRIFGKRGRAVKIRVSLDRATIKEALLAA